MGILIARATDPESGFKDWYRSQPESRRALERGPRRDLFSAYLSELRKRVCEACPDGLVTVGTLSLEPGDGRIIVSTQGECAKRAMGVLRGCADLEIFDRMDYLGALHARLQRLCPEALLQELATPNTGTIVFSDRPSVHHVSRRVQEREYLHSVSRVLPMGERHLRDIEERMRVSPQKRDEYLASPEYST